MKKIVSILVMLSMMLSGFVVHADALNVSYTISADTAAVDVGTVYPEKGSTVKVVPPVNKYGAILYNGASVTFKVTAPKDGYYKPTMDIYTICGILFDMNCASSCSMLDKIWIPTNNDGQNIGKEFTVEGLIALKAGENTITLTMTSGIENHLAVFYGVDFAYESEWNGDIRYESKVYAFDDVVEQSHGGGSANTYNPSTTTTPSVGGNGVKPMGAGYWAAYKVNVPTEDTYDVYAQIAKWGNNDSVTLDISANETSAVKTMEPTADYVWQYIGKVTLNSGENTVRAAVTEGVAGVRAYKFVGNKEAGQTPTIDSTYSYDENEKKITYSINASGYQDKARLYAAAYSGMNRLEYVAVEEVDLSQGELSNQLSFSFEAANEVSDIYVYLWDSSYKPFEEPTHVYSKSN